MDNFKQWIEQFGDSMQFLQRWAPKHQGTKDISIPHHGGYASFGYGMHQKIQDPEMRSQFLQGLPADAKIVQVDVDGESLYRVVEMPDGSHVAEKNIPGQTAGWVNIPGHKLSGFPSSWGNAVNNVQPQQIPSEYA